MRTRYAEVLRATAPDVQRATGRNTVRNANQPYVGHSPMQTNPTLDMGFHFIEETF